jgi:hypothetical protein
MEKLSVELRNCHGIRELDATFDFKNGNAVAIYAPNGTMKTSFARTLADLANGVESKDNMFPDRESTRTVSDQDGTLIDPADVVVVLSYDEELGPTESTSTLLVNSELRKEYETLQRELIDARDVLGAALKAQSGTKQDVANTVSRVFTQQTDNFFPALVRVGYEVEEQEDAPFAGLPYDVLFNARVDAIVRSPTLQAALSEYVTRLNELLDLSTFFSRSSFNFYNASNITKSLGDNGFFTANHSLLLHDEEAGRSVSSQADFEALILEEKRRITDDDALRKKMEAVEKALNKNADTRAFFEYISSHEELLPEFANVDLFEQKLWKSYLKVNEELFQESVRCFKASEKRRKEIEQQAAKESTEWEKVIRIFNARFFVPFRLTATNHDQVVLGQEKLLVLGFEFEEGTEKAGVEKSDLLKVLSNGEKKALYILNVLFEMEVRKAAGRETLFVIDDLADSFDYKNKYAIIQYLKEMAEHTSFKLVLLTHNFDFFRTLKSRQVVGYDRCFMAQKGSSGVLLTLADSIVNPFVNDFKKFFYVHGMKRLACIPFARNILEYTKGKADPDYLKLTSLLHWKEESASIDNAELDRIFGDTFAGANGRAWGSPNDSVVDLLLEQADLALEADEGVNFANKIVLSIAIRLLADQHMIAELSDSVFVDGLKSNQTSKLFAEYCLRSLGTAHTKKTLDEVALMTPENIHVNSFMYEPIIDMSDVSLRRLYSSMKEICTVQSADGSDQGVAA